MATARLVVGQAWLADHDYQQAHHTCRSGDHQVSVPYDDGTSKLRSDPERPARLPLL
jgi:hypothetical protein